jgi:hypothetical protein
MTSICRDNTAGLIMVVTWEYREAEIFGCVGDVFLRQAVQGRIANDNWICSEGYSRIGRLKIENLLYHATQHSYIA